MKKVILIIFAVLFMFSITSCTSQNNTPMENVTTNEPSDSTTVKIDESNEIELKDSPNQKINNLGSVSNTLSDLVVSADYNPAQAKVLSLTDPEGNEWNLIIPKYALIHSETISMQYIKEPKQDIFSGNLFKGVVLKPEGLNFITTVFLTVKGPIVSEKSHFFSATSEGDSVNLNQSFFHDNQISASIEHFSSYYTYTPTTQSEWDELIAAVEADYKKTVNEVEEFLKTPISAPPIPPDFDFTCEKTEFRPLNVYIQRVIQPEKDYTIKILAANRELSLYGKDEYNGMWYAQQLQKRVIKKVDKLIQTYKNDNKKLIPVMNLAFHVYKNAAVLGMDTNFNEYSQVFSKWIENAGDELIDRIKNEDYYSGLCKIIPLFHGKAVLESDFSQSNEFYEKSKDKLAGALSFELSFEGEVNNFESVGNSKWKIDGTVPLNFDIDTLLSEDKFLQGTGTCKYTDFKGTEPDIKMQTTTDEVNVTVKIKEITDQGYDLILLIDKINPDTLHYIDTEDGGNFTFENMHYTFASLFEKNYNGVSYEIPISLRNGQGEMTESISGNVEISNIGGSSSGRYEFTLKHTPK